jgi:hypothetical protein
MRSTLRSSRADFYFPPENLGGLRMSDPGLRLFIGTKFTGVTVEPDGRWSGMWRVHQGDMVSDMVNLTRAKEAAIMRARPKGLGGSDVARWDRRQIGGEAPSVRFPATKQRPITLAERA